MILKLKIAKVGAGLGLGLRFY